jgi:hypothetical protein
VREEALAPKPANLTLVQAAAVPTSALIAHRALLGEGSLRAGQTILVNGAGGGVGTFAVQIAKAYGAARVTAVDGPERGQMLRSIGRTRSSTTRGDFTAGRAIRPDPRHPGNRSWRRSRPPSGGRPLRVSPDTIDSTPRHGVDREHGTFAKCSCGRRSTVGSRVRSFKDREDRCRSWRGSSGGGSRRFDAPYPLGEIRGRSTAWKSGGSSARSSSPSNVDGYQVHGPRPA